MGITDHAQKELGDVVFVELPEIGHVFCRGRGSGKCGIREGRIRSLRSRSWRGGGRQFEPGLLSELVNEDPYGEAWFVRIRLVDSSDLDNLLTADQYRNMSRRSLLDR